MTVEEITGKLKSQLKESRFEHSLSVAKTSAELAQIYGASEKKAYLAGLVHDCAKCYSDSELIQKAQNYGIDEDALRFIHIMHSFVGAYEIKNEYGIDDEEIFDAVYYHTVGKPDMPLITAIVYLADAIEPGRNYPGVDRIRKVAEASLEKAIYIYTEECINHVLKKGGQLHPNALEVRDYYRRKI